MSQEKDQCQMTAAHDARSDAELVGAYLGGDRGALGLLYDRFAGGLYDTARAMLGSADDAADVVQDVFCVAAAKLDQLREPDRVKPWLYAIARHEVFKRTRRRRRELRGLDADWEIPAAADARAEGAALESAELGALVRGAAAGLEPGDQLVLELSVRQGLAGEDLAGALGVTVGQSHSMVFRMRERIERAIGAYVVTRGRRTDCPELAAVLTGWDGTFDVLWRKRIARHVDGCDTCAERRRVAVGMVALAPAFAAPAWLRERTLRASASAGEPAGYRFDGSGFPVDPRRAPLFGSARTAVAATVLALLGLAVALPLLAGGDPDLTGSIGTASTSPTSATSTTSSSTSTSTPTTTSSAARSTTTPTTVVVAPPPPPPTEPTTTAPPRVLVAPTAPSTTTAPATTTTTTTSTTTSTTAPPSPPNQPPRVSRVEVRPATWTACQPPRVVSVTAVVTDDSATPTVSGSWSGPGGSGSMPMSGTTTYSGSFAVTQHVPGPYSATVTARDDDGATASASTSFTITRC
jgi:RNA polymerase sigma factor (sigma-70 family)